MVRPYDALGSTFCGVHKFIVSTPQEAIKALSITIRFDDGNAAFAPNATSFIKDLAKHKKVIIGFEPYGSVMKAVEFDLTGTDKVAAQIAEACNWKM